MHPSEIQVTNVAVGDLQANQRGGKLAPLTVDGKALRLKLRGVTTPFAVSAFDKTSSRKALDLRTTEDLRAFAHDWTLPYSPLPRNCSATPTVTNRF